MNGHYFKFDPNLKEDSKIITETINGNNYRFYTDSGVFSRTKVDLGSLILLKEIKINKNAKSLLDLGSGYGPIGITLKKEYPHLDVYQTDVNEKAVELCKKNSEFNEVKTTCFYSDGFNEINKSFDLIVLNPPIRAGKEVVFKLYKDSYKNLNENGEFWLVIRKKQGAPSHQIYLKAIFENVKIIAKSKGYYVIKCEKNALP